MKDSINQSKEAASKIFGMMKSRATAACQSVKLEGVVEKLKNTVNNTAKSAPGCDAVKGKVKGLMKSMLGSCKKKPESSGPSSDK